MAEVKLKNRSVVFLVQGNQPTMFTEKFISKNEIFPDDYTLKNKTSIPPLTQYEYKEGYVFQAVDNRILLNCNYKEPLSDISTISSFNEIDRLNETSLNLYSSVDYLDFNALGVNFKFDVIGSNLDHIIPITDKTGTNITQLKLSKHFEDYILFYNISRAKSDSFEIEFNFHHELSKLSSSVIDTVIQDILKKPESLFKTTPPFIETIIG